METVCPFCGCGCGIIVGARGGRIVSSRAVPGHPASGGSLCVKGRFGLGFVNHPDRLKTPLIRRGEAGGSLLGGGRLPGGGETKPL